MITKTKYTCDIELINQCYQYLENIDTPLILNEPTGEFFTDPWTLKKEFNDTIWSEIYKTLDIAVGQARIISLLPASCYHCHADIDDRYHLNLSGEESYLVDLTNKEMYKIDNDGLWYAMDAGKIHSAVNFGRYPRYQLVVRKLLSKNVLIDPISIKIVSSDLENNDARFIFDNTISSWLNISHKENKISNFRYDAACVELSIEKDHMHTLASLLPNNIKVIYND